MEYPLSLSEQIKFLKENLDFFKGFGKYTEPYENKVISKIVEDYKERSLYEKLQSSFEIPKYFKEREKMIMKIPTVKEMEDEGKALGTIEYSLLSVAILRKLGFPSAIVYSVNVNSLFQNYDEGPDGKSFVIAFDGSRWWAVDVVSRQLTRFLVSKNLKEGFVVGLIYRDPEDLGFSSKGEIHRRAVENLRDVLLLDIQVDVIKPEYIKT